ncbi:type IX secretion system membrane protein PorP/SprF [Bacteroidales bacterium AH-315-I05]|nr:type IX secretion system membrane protein PorP/SprF [Bacteroidales bacterium AH-315-I05]
MNYNKSKIIMKKALIISLLLASSTVFTQQLPYYSQYMFNDYFINPAVAGSKESGIASISARAQWVGFKDAPSTQTAGMHSPLLKNMGVGGFLYNHSTGPIRTTGLQLSYAYHIKINDEQKVALGLSGMFYQHTLDKNDLKAENPNDAALLGEKEKIFAPDVSFGVYYYGENHYVGISAPQMFQTRLNYNDYNDSIHSNKLVRHYFMHGGYNFELNADFDIEPSVLLKYVANAPFQFDINAKVKYKDLVWLGVSYRDKESVVAMVGMEKSNFIVGYSYDVTLSNIRKHSSGSHEIYLGLRIKSLQQSSTMIE